MPLKIIVLQYIVCCFIILTVSAFSTFFICICKHILGVLLNKILIGLSMFYQIFRKTRSERSSAYTRLTTRTQHIIFIESGNNVLILSRPYFHCNGLLYFLIFAVPFADLYEYPYVGHCPALAYYKKEGGNAAANSVASANALVDLVSYFSLLRYTITLPG